MENIDFYVMTPWHTSPEIFDNLNRESPYRLLKTLFSVSSHNIIKRKNLSLQKNKKLKEKSENYDRSRAAASS